MNKIKGDATAPVQGYDRVVIMHCCNNIGLWGAGFVVPLGKRYPEAKAAFLREQKPDLGHVIFADTGHVIVANIIGQNGVRGPRNPIPVSYTALQRGFEAVDKVVSALETMEYKTAIQFPKLGCGLAGGDWEKVEALIESVLGHHTLYLVDL
jgi:hypothetical protein